MQRTTFILFTATLFILTSCTSTSPVRQFQPNTLLGGHAVAIAVHPTDDQRIIVASRAGGLFRSTNRGATWAPIEGLPSFEFYDVAYSPVNPSIVIATSEIDTRVENSGGIWRSTDGGNTWSKPRNATPPASERCGDLITAFGISFSPNSERVYVGTDCGLAISNTMGESWGHSVLDPDEPIIPTKTQNRVLAVKATASGFVYALSATGFWVYEPAMDDWRLSESAEEFRAHFRATVGINSIALSPLHDGHVFFAHPSGGGISYSLDHGATWQQLCGRRDAGGIPCSHVGWNKNIFTARSASGIENHFDLYTWQSRFTFKYNPDADPSTPSLEPSRDEHRWAEEIEANLHTDLSTLYTDLGFNSAGRFPILLAHQKGLVARRPGGEWAFSNGASGYNALQIFELAGSSVLSDDFSYRSTDYFFSARRYLNTWRSLDDGLTWPHYLDLILPSYGLEVRPRSVERIDAGVTMQGDGVKIVRHDDIVTEPGIITPRFFPLPEHPDPDDRYFFDTPPIFLRPVSDIRRPSGNYRLVIVGNIESDDITLRAFVTADEGMTYRENAEFEMVESTTGGAQVVGPLAQPVVYLPIRRPENTIGLRRITGFFGGATRSITNIELDEVGGIETFLEGRNRYAIFAANPHNVDHLFAVGAQDGFIHTSTDGGSSWTVDTEATSAVIDDGRFFSKSPPFIAGNTLAPQSQALSIRFDPNTNGHILIGTRQNGIIRSRDNGASWQRIPGSSRIPNATDFHFSDDGTVVVSSDGRGLWKLDFGFETPLINVDPEELEMLEETPYIPIPESVRIDPPEGLFMVMSTAQGGNLSALPGEEIELIALGVRPKQTFGPVSFSVNGNVFNQDLPLDQEGRARVTFQASGLPGEQLTIRIEQGYGEDLQWDERQIFVLSPPFEEEENGQQ